MQEPAGMFQRTVPYHSKFFKFSKFAGPSLRYLGIRSPETRLREYPILPIISRPPPAGLEERSRPTEARLLKELTRTLPGQPLHLQMQERSEKVRGVQAGASHLAVHGSGCLEPR